MVEVGMFFVWPVLRIGNGNSLQYSCLENSTDRGAWWATVGRIKRSQTWLKWLSMHVHVCVYIYTQTHIYIYGFPCGSVIKNPPANAGDTGVEGLIPGSERSPGEGNGNPVQYSYLENPVDRGPWWATVHGVAKRQTQLSVCVCVCVCVCKI